MRIAFAALLIALALFSAALAWGALSNLWADYKDSPDSTYLSIGLPALLIAAAAATAAIRVLRR